MSVEARAVIAAFQQRLRAMAADPPYVFKDTPADLIADHYHRLTTFAGYTDSEVTQAEERLGVHFPAIFRAFLLEMGRAPGDLFRGSNLAGLDEFQMLRSDARRLMAETSTDLTLPPAAVVFLFHQGYTFCYFEAAGGFDSTVFQYTETKPGPQESAPGFAALVDAELGLMERTHRSFHEQGGYYMKLFREGGSASEFPNLASGERPLDRPATRRQWWQFWKFP